MMTKNRNQHVVSRPRGWAMNPAGSDRASSIHETQREAIDRARDIARNQKGE
ncbi:DUF2188 domain-containing protein [Mesorhizobium sp. M0761]|uniref:DUF2188 domain-containing protein n=1 Tax=Mesorhizobium sp. M0761 TaxID=2956994 RepID=UPI0033364208